ncbi:MAG: hypothetical protein ACKPCJ_07480, partial [Betaproteobacteria bacterium]
MICHSFRPKVAWKPLAVCTHWTSWSPRPQNRARSPARCIARRQRELFEAFPDAIDLVIVCMEAGLGLDAALERTAQDMALRSAA